MTATVHGIMKAAAELYGVKPEEFVGPSRRLHMAHARQRAMFMARALTEASLPRIGHVFGGRDHTTVIHGIRAVEERQRKSSDEDAELARLRIFFTAKLTAAATPLHIPKLSC